MHADAWLGWVYCSIEFHFLGKRVREGANGSFGWAIGRESREAVEGHEGAFGDEVEGWQRGRPDFTTSTGGLEGSLELVVAEAASAEAEARH